MVDLPSEIGNLTRLKDLSFSSYPSQEPSFKLILLIITYHLHLRAITI